MRSPTATITVRPHLDSGQQHGGEHGEDPHLESPEYEPMEPLPTFPTLVD